MKKTGMMFVGFFGILLAGVAGADVYKCANLYKGVECDGVTSAKGSEWSVTCNRTTVKGIAMCGGDLIESDVVYVGSEAGATCYCKMIKPAVSIWVQVTDIEEDQVTCSNYCATACAEQFLSNQAMRDMMINSVVQ